MMGYRRSRERHEVPWVNLKFLIINFSNPMARENVNPFFFSMVEMIDKALVS